MTGALTIVVVLLVGLASGCAPVIHSAGPDVGAARLEADAVVAADGAPLPLHGWEPAGSSPAAVILALHGFNDYGKAFAESADYWAENGIATLAYDQRGFGATESAGIWPGTETLVADMRAAAALVRARYPNVPFYLLGDSMGAAVLLTASRDGPLTADGVILVAPAVRGRTTMNPIYRATLWLGAHTVPWLKLTGRGLGIVASDNISMLRAQRDDPLVIKETRVDTLWGLVNLMDEALSGAGDLNQPALVLYGAHDQIIPKEPVAKLVAGLAAGARVAVYEEGYHMLLRDLSAENVRADVAAWIANPRSPLPSGAERNSAEFFGSSAPANLAEATP
jgi:alpha-beta hydrolase superfamily lysophospholipase